MWGRGEGGEETEQDKGEELDLGKEPEEEVKEEAEQ